VCSTTGGVRRRRHLVQVEDELREVLDRVNVVMRRRRDERHARLAAPQVGNVRAHLLAGQLPALACSRAGPDFTAELSSFPPNSAARLFSSTRSCSPPQARPEQERLRILQATYAVTLLTAAFVMVARLRGAARWLATLQRRRRTWLGALGDLDLQLVRVYQELRRHAKAPARHLRPQDAVSGAAAEGGDISKTLQHARCHVCPTRCSCTESGWERMQPHAGHQRSKQSSRHQDAPFN